MSVFESFFVPQAAASERQQRRGLYITSRYVDADYVDQVARNHLSQQDQRDLLRETKIALAEPLEYLEQVQQTCAYCRKVYYPAQNYGRHLCHWHPGIVLSTGYSCCDQPARAQGCQRCDHTAQLPADGNRWPEGVRVEKLPYFLLHRFDIPPAMCTLHPSNDPKHSYILVRRTDQ